MKIKKMKVVAGLLIIVIVLVTTLFLLMYSNSVRSLIAGCGGGLSAPPDERPGNVSVGVLKQMTESGISVR